ncbi:hypothetical protein [Adhaeribacter soli]|uniref:MlpB protein n=1 Tax=Adhaeribacter soli TaxID=2607655 RepID=A0A5N1IHL7_9BACT|nr:hypothetical protein [Adhaeribacter soli]KAA9325153.1 hypothetical protein F0P94_18130 [Adhaeribacter soli]
MKNYIILTGLFLGLFTASCSQQKPESGQASSPAEATQSVASTHAHDPATKASEANPMTETGLPKDLVCMVNNAYMGKKQFPVPFEDKMYYGCCEMCVKTIKNERSVRYAVDPVSGKEVDKSVAFIALKPGSSSGEVQYFESEKNYQASLN